MCCQMHKGWQQLTHTVNKQTDIHREQQTNLDEDGYNLLLKHLMCILSLVPIYNIIIIFPSVIYIQVFQERTALNKKL